MKSGGYLVLEEEREIESVLMAVDESCDLALVDGVGLALVVGVRVVGLVKVEEGRALGYAGAVCAEGIEKGLGFHFLCYIIERILGSNF